MEKLILDACCGSKMFWFNKDNPEVLFADKRTESHILCDGRKLEIKPDIEADFTAMPFPENAFKLVVFDPPHLQRGGDTSWIVKKYGRLPKEWSAYITKGASECFRVLKPGGILIFKWNEDQIKVSEILKCFEHKPLFGHPSGKAMKTHWITFMKPEKPNQ